MTGTPPLQPSAGGCRAPGVPQLWGETDWGMAGGRAGVPERRPRGSGASACTGMPGRRQRRAGGIVLAGDDGAGGTHRDAGNGAGAREEPCGE